MGLTGLACGKYFELWVGVEVVNDPGELLLNSKSAERSCDGLWVDLVKGLLPVKEEKVKGVLDCFCLNHQSPDYEDVM